MATIAFALTAFSSAAQPAAALEPGFRQLEGRHLTLITDAPAKEDLSELTKTFDAAFPLWCQYFGLDADKLADWHVTGYLMKSREHFQEAGYWQADLPPFPNGYSAGKQFWLYDQASPYYRSHLLLHEGVHSFMFMHLGQGGPTWYMEGMAELLATHHWHDGRLTVGWFPTSSGEVQQLGRIEIIQNALAAGRPHSVADVLALHGATAVGNDGYGWAWGLAALLDGHPRYRQRFRTLGSLLRSGDFEPQFRRLFADDWDRLTAEWQAYVAAVDYGFDFDRMAIDFRPGQPLAAGEGRATIDVDHGWQSSGLRLEAGKTYELTARGRYRIVAEPTTWWCEPGGVTIRYYRGRPLGVLLGAVAADPPATGNAADATPIDSWANPNMIGLHATVAPAETGTLYLRVNEPPGELADDAGSLELIVREAAAPQ
ncbi:MAG TPA: hypothetical protein VMF30_16095 [Pirellulales bacterium]|nr:hypothetical protein [Pirellulales bacterium]